jgi:hypothetical protein
LSQALWLNFAPLNRVGSVTSNSMAAWSAPFTRTIKAWVPAGTARVLVRRSFNAPA